MQYSATYSPDDNKLRLYASMRLDTETYARVKAAGFRWAPKQDLFVAPAWTPGREDLLIELCGEIDDEDKSLVERAEERSDRFETYSEKRREDAKRANAAVSAITDNIPLGQPILVGHHSARHARRDAEKIENGMRRAVKMWDTSNYWSSRAKGAIRAAKYKERPDVRSRRIKTLESDKRKVERRKSSYETQLALWQNAALTREGAIRITNYEVENSLSGVKLPNGETYWSAWSAITDGKVEWQDVQRQRVEGYPPAIAHCARWISHYENRLAYEREMLNEQIGAEPGTANAMASRFDLKPGGKVLHGRGEWLTIIRVNKSEGQISSVTTTSPRDVTWSPRWKVDVEKIKYYQPPTEEQAAAIKKQSGLAPLCNYPGDGFEHITKAEWEKKHKDYKTTRIVKASETVGMHRVRHAMFPVHRYAHVYLTDQKRVDPPAPIPDSPTPDVPLPAPQARPPRTEHPDAATFDAMRGALKNGVQVVVAEQLFETPVAIVDRMLDEANLQPGDRILEPSAGTGNIAGGAVGRGHDVDCIEINPKLARILQISRQYASVTVADFLSIIAVPHYDKVLMNPPFANKQDVKHVMHAIRFVKPGGRLVALMSAGIEFRTDKHTSALREFITFMGGTIERLPSGAFKEAGTSVEVCLVVIDA